MFISQVATNPSTLLGYGTWAAVAAGRVLVGIDATQVEFDTAGETGGAKTHTLTAQEIPSHTHAVSDPGHNHTQNPHSHGMAEGMSDGSGTFMDRSNSSAATTATTDAATATNNSATTGISLGNTGGGGPHNNLPPYLVVYMWARTA